jgi:hypothetical protein
LLEDHSEIQQPNDLRREKKAQLNVPVAAGDGIAER